MANCQTPGSTGLAHSSPLHCSKTAPPQEPSASTKSVSCAVKDQICTLLHYRNPMRHKASATPPSQISSKNASSTQATTAVSDGARTRCTTSPTSQVLPISTLTTANANFLSRTSPAVPSSDPPIQVDPKQATMPVPVEHRALCLATVPSDSAWRFFYVRYHSIRFNINAVAFLRHAHCHQNADWPHESFEDTCLKAPHGWIHESYKDTYQRTPHALQRGMHENCGL
jgi:hypothetical protein